MEVPRVHPACTGPLADLVVDRSLLTSSLLIKWVAAPKDHCLVEEGCLSGDGHRKVLAFSTRVRNIGCAPFVVGVPSGYAPGCFDTIGNRWEGDGSHLEDCPPRPAPPPPSLPSGGGSMRGRRMAGATNTSNGHYSGSTKARSPFTQP